MSRTRPLRPMLLATLGLVLILGVLPVAPSAADDGGIAEPTATTLETVEEPSTTIAEPTTTEAPAEDGSVVADDDTTLGDEIEAEPTDEPPLTIAEDPVGEDPAGETDDDAATEEDTTSRRGSDDEVVAPEVETETFGDDGKGGDPPGHKPPEPEAKLTVTKTVAEGPTIDDSGNFEIVYQIVVSNQGGKVGYTLEDALLFGEGITITSATITNTVPGHPTIGSWNGRNHQRVVNNEHIEENATHLYRIVARGTVPADISDAAADCVLAKGEEGTGFLNRAFVTYGKHMDKEVSDSACAPVVVSRADIEVAKTLTSGPTRNEAGNYELTYEIVVSNEGRGAGKYDLADRLRFGEGITVVSAAVTNTVPGGIATDPAWNGLNKHQVAQHVTLAGGEAHTYQVTVEAMVPADITDRAADCVLEHGEDGTGFLNKAIVRVGKKDSYDTACAGVPDAALTLAKMLTSGPTRNAAGYYDLTYQLVVSNTGEGPGRYDLSDALAFGEGIVVVSATVNGGGVPDHMAATSLTVNAGWDGVTDTTVATDVAIAAGDTHTYTVEVEAMVPADISKEAADCELTEEETGTGFLNTAAMRFDGEDFFADACARVPDPALTLAKTLTSGPTRNAAGNYDLIYQLVVSNAGEGPGVYDLTDTLAFGEGIVVVSATVDGGAPAFPLAAGEVLTVNAGWDGVTDTTVATDVAIAAGETHIYTVYVEAMVPDNITEEAADTELTEGEDGTGFLNRATLTADGEEIEAEAVAPAEVPDIDDVDDDDPGVDDDDPGDDDEPDGDDDEPDGDDDEPDGDDDSDGDDDEEDGTTREEDELPFTGMPALLWGAMGIAMLTAGSGLVWTVRRRKEDD